MNHTAPNRRTISLTPTSVEALAAILPASANGSAAEFGLPAPSICRSIQAAACVAQALVAVGVAHAGIVYSESVVIASR